MTLNNPWLKYIDRSYEQVKTAILSQFPNKTPELTDHTENNVFVRLVSVWAGITEMLSYYIDVVAREFYLISARYYSSAVKTANLFNYRIRGVKSSTTTIRFTINQVPSTNITIPKYTKLTDNFGLEFFTLVESVLLQGESYIDIPAKQGIIIDYEEIGISSGQESQEFELTSSVEDGSMEVIIDGVNWTFVENLAFYSSTDLVFTTSINKDKKVTLIFGDGITGKIPANGSSILISYIDSKASLGNIPKNTIINLDSTIVTPNSETFEVTNIENANGGKEIESLADLKKNIPLSIRTLSRGVTIQDVQDLVLLYGGIDSTIINKTANGIDIYISPAGGGNTNQLFKDNLLNYLTNKMQQLVLINYTIKDVFTLYPIINIDVKLNNNFIFQNEVLNIKNHIINYVSNIDINEPLTLGNIYEQFESLSSIKFSDNLKLNYMLPIIGNKVLNISYLKIKAIDNPINNLYKIQVNSSNLTLFKNNISIINFNFNENISVDDFDLTIQNNGYVQGDNWEFYIYNINKSIYPSTISNYKLLENNIIINEL